MGNELLTQAPGLPGIGDADDGYDVVEQFHGSISREGSVDELPRLPNLSERQMIEGYAARKVFELRPVARDRDDKAAALRAFGRMFAGFPSMRNADGPKTAALYLADLEEWPLWAIERACEDVRKNRIKNSDPNFPPSSPLLYRAAKGYTADVTVRLMQAERILKVTKALPPPPTAEQAKRLGDKLAELADDMLANRKAEKDGTMSRSAARAKEEGARMLEREYVARGIKPIVGAAGLMISPELAKQLGRVLPPATNANLAGWGAPDGDDADDDRE